MRSLNNKALDAHGCSLIFLVKSTLILCLSNMLNVGFLESKRSREGRSHVINCVCVRVIVVAEALPLLTNDISPIKVPSDILAISLLSLMMATVPFWMK